MPHFKERQAIILNYHYAELYKVWPAMLDRLKGKRDVFKVNFTPPSTL